MTTQELADAGIKRVPDDKQITKEINGEKHEVQYVATECPFSEAEVTHSTTKERVLDLDESN
jgi:hypothetical protein